MSNDPYKQFLDRVKEIDASYTVQALLDWDMETQMPRRAAPYRAEQLALVAGVMHEKQTADELGNLLDQLEREGAADDPARAANLREVRRDFDRAVKLPGELVRAIARESALAKDAWLKARSESNFDIFAPHLEKLLDLKRDVAERFGYEAEPYDALMDEYEPGALSAEVERLFDAVKAELVPLVAAIKDAPRQPDLSILERDCPVEAQAAFNHTIAEALCFEFDAGRIDVSAHPFCTSMSPMDVRLTTRYDKNYMPMSLFGIMHETGHGLYEQGLDYNHVGTPMCRAVSLGLHESQSRLWENQVGRSRAFWKHFFPKLKQAFPALADVALDDWHFAINNVRPSLIRVEADEVTYGLHIMLRFDLERRMIRNELAVRDIPQAWNDGMKQLLGITPDSDADGCLQDIHWSSGTFGYFPTYQLGNLYSAQIFQAARDALPDFDERLAAGDVRPLREWLRENIHRHGQRYRSRELIKLVTGRDPSPEPYLAYLRGKFKPLYGLA